MSVRWPNDNLHESGDQRKSELKRICKVNESNVNSFNYQNQHLKGCNLIQLHKSLPVPLCNRRRRPQLIVIVPLRDNNNSFCYLLYSPSVDLSVGQCLLPAAQPPTLIRYPPWTNLDFSGHHHQIEIPLHGTLLVLIMYNTQLGHQRMDGHPLKLHIIAAAGL